MTRKEKREMTYKKRGELVIEISNVLWKEYDKSKDFSDALKFTDKYIYLKVKADPQNKTLIMSAAIECKNILEDALKKYQEAKIDGVGCTKVVDDKGTRCNKTPARIIEILGARLCKEHDIEMQKFIANELGEPYEGGEL